MYYDQFVRICNANGKSPSRVLTDLGMSRGTLGYWKSGSEPFNETKAKVARYFGLTMPQWDSGMLTVEENKKMPTLDLEHGQNFDNEILSKFYQLSEEQRRLILLQVDSWLRG